MLRFAPAFKGRYIASTRGGVTDNIARISVSMLAACAGSVAHEGSATISTSIAVSASGQQTDQQHFGTATVGVVISSTASASVTSTHSGTATASIVITTTAAGETGQTYLGTASCQVNLSVSASGLIFDPLTQVLDESGNGNTMTLVSSPSSSTTPSFSADAAIGSRSVDFDRSSDHGATVPSTYEDVLDSPFTFSAWLKPNDGQTTQVNYIFSSSGEFKRASGTSEWTFQVFTHQSGDIVAGIQYWNGTSSKFRRRQTLNPAFSDGAQSSWTHLAVTVDSTCTPIIYINGSSVTVANNGNDTLSLSNFFSVDSFASIGAYGSVNGLGQYVPSFEYDGKLDDISIWSTALTSTQISNLYNSGNGTDLAGSSNLAAWWKMGDGNAITHSGTASCQVNLSASAAGINTNTTVPDETVNGNNMTLVNGPLFTSDSAVGSRATDFDGTNDYAQFSSTYQSVLRSSFSFSLWARLPDGDASFIRLLMNYPHGDSSSPDYLQFYTQSGLLKAYYRAGGVALSVNQTTGALGNGDSGWLHLVLVGIRTSSTNHTLKIYKNGSEVASNQASGGGTIDFDDFTTTEKIAIGRQSSSSGSQIYHDYKIDDVSIWSKSLSSTEVSSLYNSGSGTSLTGSSDLEGWWKMGDHSVLPVTHSGTATVSVAVTTSANGNLLELHSRTASIGVTILSTASGTTTQTHSGTASCQVNLSASASGSVSTPYSNNYSASFDGSDDLIEVDGFNAQNIIGNGEHTVSLWVKFDTISNYDSIFYMGGSTNNSDYLQLRLREVSSQLRYQVSGRKGGSGNSTVEATTLPATGSWVHLAYTRTGTGTGATIKIYVNGSYEATATNGEFDAPLGSSSAGTLTNISAFRSSAYSQYGIDGKIDEVAIWDSALTAAEITKVYNSGEPFNLTSNNGSYTSSADLQGYWRFEDNTVSGSNGTIADSSGNSRTATTKNGVSFSTDLPVYSNNYSIALDGTNQYLSVSDHNDFSFGNSTTDSAFSVAAWIKMDDATKFRIFSKQTNSSNIEYVFGVDGLDRLGVNLYDGATSNYRGVYSSSIQSHEGSWIHVAMTYDGTGGSTAYNGMKLYLNGSALSTSSNSGGGYTAMHNTTTDVWIGGANFVPDYANGKIDEVAVFSSELTSTQVSNIYNNGAPTNLSSESNLVGYWRMEENTGTTVADTSGNGHTATLNNSPTFSTDVPSSSSSGFTISTFDTETNILASTPSNGTVAYGTDTESYYVYDSSLGWAEFTPT